MKKTIITALVVLLVILAFATCDSFITEPGAEKAEYTADGRKLVTVKVNTGEIAGNRSLSNNLREKEANYAEVVFYKGGEYYRAQGFLALGLSIKIPEGSYAIGDAILLIGRNSDKTLLATGLLKPDAWPLQIATSTKTITFEATALKADLNAGATLPSIVFTKLADDSNNTNASKFTTKTTEGLFDDKDRCFQVPTDTKGIEATLTIGGEFDRVATNILFIDDSDVTPVEFKKAKGDDEITIDVDDDLRPAPGGSFTDNTIVITFTTTSAGEYIIVFNIPVAGFSLDPGSGSAPLTWFIRGGTEAKPDFTGGGEYGVALLVAETPASGGGVDVGVIIP